MAETKAERRAAWKKTTTAHAAALKKAGATVTRGGKRTVPLTAKTPAEIRVAAFRAEHPERVVVDPVTGKHTRIDTRTGAATVISKAPGEAMDISIQDVRTIGARDVAERERAAASAAMVAEARARPPGVTEPTYAPTPVVTDEYVPSPYIPGTLPEDVDYGDPELRIRMEPQITDIHETIGGIIDVSAKKFKEGVSIGEGKEVKADITSVKDPKKYVTRDIFDFITEKTEDYRRAIESAEAQSAIRAGIKAPTFLLPTPEIKEDAPIVRYVTGALQAPAMLPDIAASLLLGAEHAIRTKGEVYKELPLAAGVMIGGMKREVIEDPFRFAGEMTALPIISKLLPTVKVKPVEPTVKVKIKPSYDPIGFPAEFGKGKPVRKYIKKIPEELKTFLKAEEAVVELKKLRKKQKADPTAKLKEKWAKREKELETLAKEGGYTVTKEGQVLISKVKQEPTVVSLIKDPWLEQFKMKPEEIVYTKMKVYPKVEVGKKVDVYIAKPTEVVKVFEPFKKEVSPQKLFERTQVVQSLKELQRLKSLQEPITVVKAKPAVKAKAQTKSLQEQRSALVVLLKTAETQSQREELRSIIASIDTQISSVSSTALVIQAPVITVDGIPPMPKPSKYIIPPIPTVDEVPPKPYQYVPPPIPMMEEIPPMPKMIPTPKPKEPKKVVGRVIKETPGYAWQLANPIASLEQLLGVQKTTKRKATRKKSSKRTKSRK